MIFPVGVCNISSIKSIYKSLGASVYDVRTCLRR